MARIFLAELITTVATGVTDVCTWDPPGGGGTLKVLGLGGEPTTWTTTEASLGYCYPDLAGMDKRGMEVRVMAGDVTGINIQYLIVEIPGGLAMADADVVKIQADPAGATSTRWRGIILANE